MAQAFPLECGHFKSVPEKYAHAIHSGVYLYCGFCKKSVKVK